MIRGDPKRLVAGLSFWRGPKSAPAAGGWEFEGVLISDELMYPPSLQSQTHTYGREFAWLVLMLRPPGPL